MSKKEILIKQISRNLGSSSYGIALENEIGYYDSNIFGKLNTYGDNVPGLDIKLKILLHNMYFNCDIGNNHD